MRILVVGATGVIGRAVADALAARGHEVLRALYARIGRVDGVVSCAGGAAFKPLLDNTDEDFAMSLRDKLMGQVNLVRFGVEHVNDGGGFVVTAGI